MRGQPSTVWVNLAGLGIVVLLAFPRHVSGWLDFLPLIAGVTGALLAFLELETRWIGRRNKWARTGRCTRCGYDLRATPDRCPECGTPTKAEAKE